MARTSPRSRRTITTQFRRARQRTRVFQALEPRRLLAPIAFEGFESYVAGDALESAAGVGLNGGVGWTSNWNVDDARRAYTSIVAGGLSYSAGDLNLNGGNLALRVQATVTDQANAFQLASRQFAGQTGTLYFGFLYNNSVDAGTAAESANDFVQTGFDNTALPNPRFSVMDNSGTWQARSTTTTAAPQSVNSSIATNAGTTYFVVLKAEKTGGAANYNRISVFINPTTATEPAAPTIVVPVDSGADLTTNAFLALRIAFLEAGDTYLFDDFRIGTTYQDVVVTLPPATGANDVVWDGGAGDNDWNNPVNWVGDANIPNDPTETAVFQTGNAIVSLNGQSQTIAGLRFDNSLGSSITINNGTLTLVSGLRQAGTAINTINARLNAGAGFVGNISSGALNLTDTTNVLGGTFNVTGGVLAAVGSDVSGALGSAALNINGGTVRALPGPTGIYEGLQARLLAVGAAGGGDAVTDANIAAALAAANVVPSRVLFGQTVDFPADSDGTLASLFNTTTANTNTFIALFVGRFTAPVTGDYSFLVSHNDDRAFLWLDRDGNQTFSTAGGLGSELITSATIGNNNTGVSTVTGLAAGTYNVVFGVRDTGGGSGVTTRFGDPGLAATALSYVRPGAQTGRWTFSGTAGPGNFTANAVTIGAAGGTIDLATGSAGARFGALDLTSGGTLQTTGALGSGGVRDTIRFEGQITLPTTGAAPINTLSADLALTGQVTGAAGLNKLGAGVLYLSNNANNYAGVTTINAGTITVSAASGLGLTAAGTVVNSGGQLYLNDGVTLDEPLSLAGLGVNSTGALRTRGSTINYNGPITLTANAEIQAEDNALLINGGINVGSFTVTFDSQNPNGFTANITVQNLPITGAGGFAKNSGGNLTLPIANNVAGTVTINGGATSIGTNGSLGTGTIALQSGRLRSTAATAGGDRTLTNPLQFTGDTTLGDGTNTGILTFTGNGLLTGSRTLTIDSVVNFNGIIDDGASTFGLTKAGGSMLVLNGTNSYDGATFVNAGTLRVTSASGLGTTVTGTRVNNGGTLELNGNFTLAGENFAISGSGVGNVGALNGVGAPTIPGNIQYASAATIGAAAGATLTLSGTIGSELSGDITFAPTGTINVTGNIVPAQAPTFGPFNGRLFTATGLNIGSATTTPNNINTIAFTGTPANTAVLNGPLAVANDAAFGTLFGNTAVGGNTSNFTAAFVGTVTINAAGTYYFAPSNNDDGAAAWLDVNQDGTFTQTELVLATTGNGSTTVPAGLNLNPGTYTVVYVVQDTGGGSSLTGRFEPGIVPPSSATNMFIPDPTLTPSPTQVVKNGTGTLSLSGNNTYNGTTTINAGTLVAASTNALGTLGSPTIVNSAGRLGFGGNVNVAAEQVTLNGGGIDNLSGNNSFAGNISIAASTAFAQLDLGRGSQRVEPGFTGISVGTTADITGNFPTTIVNSATGFSYTVAIDAVAQNGSIVGAIDWRDRGDGPAGTLVQLGEDHLKNNGGIIRITLGNLPAGTYATTGYHLDPSATQSSQINVFVNTGNGYVQATPPGQIGNANFTAPVASLTQAQVEQTRSTFTFTADGINPVQIVFDGRTPPNADNETPVGGLVLELPAPVGNLNINAAANSTLVLTGVLDDGANSASVTKTGDGTVELRAANTYDGSTFVNAGLLIAANNSALGTTASGTVIADSARLGFAGNISVGAENVSINGRGALENVSGNNTFGGNVQVNTLLTAGPNFAQLDIGRGSQRVEPGYSGVSVGTTADIAGNFPTTPFTSLTGANYTVAIDSIDQSGATVGAIDWRDRGDGPAGTLVQVGEDHLKNNAGVIRVTLTGIPAGTYFGTGYHLDPSNTQSSQIRVFVNTGGGFNQVTLPGTAGNSNVTAPVATLTQAQVEQTRSTFTFIADGINPVVLVFDGRGAPNADLETPLGGIVLTTTQLLGGLTINTAANSSLRHNGSINDGAASIPLTKTGGGTLTLAGNNAYDGGTTVGGGALFVGNSAGSATGTGTVVVQSGGVFGGNGNVAGSVTIQNGAAINPGFGGDDTGTIAIGGNLDLQPGSTAESDINGALFDQSRVSGNVTIASGQVIPAGDIVNPPVAGVNYVVLSNVGTGTTTGTFATLPNGATFDFDGRQAVIFYTYNESSGQFTGGNDIIIVFNRPPVATNDTFTLTEDANFSGNVITNTNPNGADSDPDGNPVTAALVGAAPAGTFSLASNGNFTYRPPNGFAGTVQFQYQLADNSSALSNIATVTLNITPVADAPTLVVQPTLGNEDSQIPLSFSATTNDPDGSESLSYRISNVPTGATLSAGTSVGGGVWNLTPAQIAGLRITPPVNSDIDFSLQVTAIATESVGGSTAQTSADLLVTVNAVADAPTLTAPAPLSVGENKAIALGIVSQLVDNDGSETLSVLISGVPSDASLSAGTNLGAGQWQLTGPQLAGLTLLKRNNNPGNAPFTLSIVATATETAGGSTASANASTSITVINLPPAPRLDDVQLLGESVGLPTSLKVIPGLTFSFVVSTTDPAFDHLDAPFRFSIDWGDGVGVSEGIALQENAPLTFSYAYNDRGTFQPTLTVTDENGNGLSASIDLTPVTATTIANVDGVVYIGGSSSSDRIILAMAGGGLSVRINNALQPAQSVSQRVVVFGNGGSDTITASSNIIVPVSLFGGEGDDYLTGGNASDLLDGGEGRDRLLGGNGHDVMLGGPGDDTLSGGNGHDYASGDEMVDLIGGTLLPDGSLSLPGQIIDSGALGRDTLSGDAGNDTLVGGAGVDTLNGGVGNDYLRGDDGGDKLDGGDGNDLLFGGLGGDTLSGRAGRDLLIGGAGIDTLLGGAGADLLMGSDLDESFAADDLQLRDLWQLWAANQSQAALDLLSANAQEDGLSDTLNGEIDTDWYLLLALDRIGVTTEQKGNKVFSL